MPSFVFGVDSIGASGGLVVLGWSSLAISCVSKTPNCVHCKIEECNGMIWNVFFVYEPPAFEDRLEFWSNFLLNIHLFSNCLLLGDFNQLELLEDKLGGTLIIRGSDDFANWKLQHNLLDVPFSGPRFTWTNKRLTQGLILERLDRGYMSNDWFFNFPESRIINQPLVASDHAAIIFDNDAISRIAKRPYQVENWCLDFHDIRTIIKEEWRRPITESPMYCLTRKLPDGLSSTNITLAQRYLNHVEEAITTAALNVTYWKQRMKETWVATGDLPTSLLYSRVKMRQRRNQVLTLKDDSGTWIENRQQVRDLVVDSMTKILCPHQRTYSVAHTDAILRELHIPTMTDKQVAVLTKPLSPDEVRRAMFSLNGDKVRGRMVSQRPSFRSIGIQWEIQLHW
ncbi:uncharacterized protein LOC110709888 [Chenopodium quinoa]|uniref:uncharacterized protein LOC110709888 n=1 Tax=Chenopodium quinoa TaxID=63459 RepID=UPI000B775120|nr:uncharacterized protein LOC110709888 [Chenopodium quinoa]